MDLWNVYHQDKWTNECLQPNIQKDKWINQCLQPSKYSKYYIKTNGPMNGLQPTIKNNWKNVFPSESCLNTTILLFAQSGTGMDKHLIAISNQRRNTNNFFARNFLPPQSREYS